MYDRLLCIVSTTFLIDWNIFHFWIEGNMNTLISTSSIKRNDNELCSICNGTNFAHYQPEHRLYLDSLMVFQLYLPFFCSYFCTFFELMDDFWMFSTANLLIILLVVGTYVFIAKVSKRSAKVVRRHAVHLYFSRHFHKIELRDTSR